MEEIISTFTIENIDFSRDSVRKIMAGYAPSDESENRITISIENAESELRST